MRTVPRLAGPILLAASLVVTGPEPGRAAATPEQKCQEGRYKAAARYAGCHQTALAAFMKAAPGVYDPLQVALSKCRVKYDAAWTKLQAAAAGTGCTCDNPRFEDNLDGTVLDRLTALEWERKTSTDGMQNYADLHDADNVYSWCVDATFDSSCDNGPVGDGSAFTDFLPSLNGACFAGRCDWRMPTIAELQTTLADPYPCTSPCIDETLFGPAPGELFWSSTSFTIDPTYAYTVYYIDGTVAPVDPKRATLHLRAVRGGL